MLLLALLGALAAVSAAPPRAHELSASYTFDQYCADFGKTFADHSAAETRFQRELARVLAHNARDASYKLGINQFSADAAGPAKGLQRGARTPRPRPLLSAAPLPFELDTEDKLPTHVDWREHNVVTATKDQGGCGSCWAFAATEVVESHVALAANGTLFNLAPQELVSCMPNEMHCGGTGGCAGATCELAFEYFAKEGILQEYQYGYSSYSGKVAACAAKPSGVPAKDKGPDPPGIAGAVAKISGYVKLPENEYLPLLNAVAKVGPIAITVDAAWGGYESGVFVQEDYSTYNLDHAVVLIGYGHDAQSGLDYWLVRNSWSPTWGEAGYIRLKRNSGTNGGKAVCGVDPSPCDGTACSPQDCNTNVTVCGTSGILYDASYPTGARLA